MNQIAYGKNTVKQLLRDGHVVHEAFLLEGMKDQELENEIHNAGISITRLSRKAMDRRFPGNHQGVAVRIEDYPTYAVSDLTSEQPYPLIVMLDGIEDPHNLGAILRSADGAGADGVIIRKQRSASLTPTVAKVSCGAIDSVKVAVVTNLSRTLDELKQKGYWIVGADLDKALSYDEMDYKMPIVLVVGNEGKGISELVKQKCDYHVSIPMQGRVASLNASVACGILLYEIQSQRKR